MKSVNLNIYMQVEMHRLFIPFYSSCIDESLYGKSYEYSKKDDILSATDNQATSKLCAKLKTVSLISHIFIISALCNFKPISTHSTDLLFRDWL